MLCCTDSGQIIQGVTVNVLCCRMAVLLLQLGAMLMWLAMRRKQDWLTNAGKLAARQFHLLCRHPA